MKKIVFGTVLLSSVFILGACSNGMGNHDMSNMGSMNMNKKDTNKSNLKIKGKEGTPLQIMNGPEVTLVAKEGKQTLKNGVVVPVWTFNGAAPGPEIRVKKGEHVKITLKNELPAPVSIHWHGYPVPNSMDGIPGVTQDAIAPGKSFTYEFTANKVGTYWYHSHQDSVNQLDRGLYGALIVEDNEKFDRDYTLMLDEWVSNKDEIKKQLDQMVSGGAKSDKDMNMSGMDHSSMNMDHMSSSMNMRGHNMSMYDVYTINGKSNGLTKELHVKKGDRVRLRFINAGYLTHAIHLHGHAFKIIATDGQSLNKPQLIKNELLSISPGERYDVEFTVKNPGKWYIEEHGEGKAVKGMKTMIVYDDVKKGTDHPNEKESLLVVDLTKYGQPKLGEFTLNTKYNLEYVMNLGTSMKGNSMQYTINKKSFPNIPPLIVKKGDLVKVTLKNTSMMDNHPMHLHGHFFQILSKNGIPVTGSPIIKDTLSLKPGEEYVVAFKADNPGNWMFHCHDLHHAAAGMVSEVKYEGYKTDYKPNASAGNMPE
ncbi:multicopper oxidase family protein [Bacillus sp. RG28]|uniref:Multicopper oxidase family protein n=1 Tax=Gottfriedia endophytica TaxID=2820819 RepID=A0A940NTL1_9BACI|nr:multicopper oxidase family protein [Gottfriedia endophytica]MBP0726847.1 multicopper oxidase family protein [Gottfriedia endophytica]